MTSQGPELRALADTLRESVEHANNYGSDFAVIDHTAAARILSALERAAAAEGEKAEACARCGLPWTAHGSECRL